MCTCTEKGGEKGEWRREGTREGEGGRRGRDGGWRRGKGKVKRWKGRVELEERGRWGLRWVEMKENDMRKECGVREVYRNAIMPL